MNLEQLTEQRAERARDRDVDEFFAEPTHNEEYLERRLSRFEDAFDGISEALTAAQERLDELEAARDAVCKSAAEGEEFYKLQRLQAVAQGLFESSFLDLSDKIKAAERWR